MTAPRLTLTLTAAAVVTAFAALALLLLPAPGSNRPVAHAAPAPTVREAHAGGTAVSSTLDDRDGLLAAVAPSTDLPQQTADAIEQTADRICEAFTDDVPVTTIEETVAHDLGVTLPEAHDLVEVTATIRCYPTPAPSSSPTA